MAPVYMAPKRMSAVAGSIVNVIGTSTATAIVAVNPGIDPITVPATTPKIANIKFIGVNAEIKLPKSIYTSPG
jgi:hypothetical protein